MIEEEVNKLRQALDELVHACQDEVDDYDRINSACKAAKKLLPDYKEED